MNPAVCRLSWKWRIKIRVTQTIDTDQLARGDAPSGPGGSLRGGGAVLRGGGQFLRGERRLGRGRGEPASVLCLCG